MIRNLKQLLSKKLDISNEERLQNEIEDIFIENNINYLREYNLNRHNRIDFYLPDEKIGIEIKIKGSIFKIYEQVERYAEFKEVEKIVLVSSKYVNLPDKIKDKEAHLIHLSEAFLL